MASLDLNGDAEEEDFAYDSDEGAINWEGSGAQGAEATHARASLTKLSSTEKRRTDAEPGRRFDHMQRLLAGAEVTEPNYEHTLVVFRDSGFNALKQHEKNSMNFEDERGMEIAQMVMGNHYLDGYVTKEFLDGEAEEHEAVFDTLGGGEEVIRILAPRVPLSSLPAGARVEEPVIRLETAAGKILKHTTVRRAYEKNPDDPFQKLLVVNEPLAKWAKSAPK